MALVLTIALVVILVAVRLLIPPVPGLLKTSMNRLGKRNTVMLCAVSLAAAVVAILISKR